jgi:hypothetical protein
MIEQKTRTTDTTLAQLQRMLHILNPEISYSDWRDELGIDIESKYRRCTIYVGDLLLRDIVEACLKTDIDLNYVTVGSKPRAIEITNFILS